MLDGKGQMVAGSGMDGIEGKYPAKPGDAYYYRRQHHGRFLQRQGAQPEARAHPRGALQHAAPPK